MIKTRQMVQGGKTYELRMERRPGDTVWKVQKNGKPFCRVRRIRQNKWEAKKGKNVYYGITMEQAVSNCFYGENDG